MRLTALLARPRSGMSTAGHASPHDHAPGAFKAQPCFAPHRPGTPVSGELLALQRIVENIRTRLPTEGYASIITRASTCLPPHHPPYSASRGAANAEGSGDGLETP